MNIFVDRQHQIVTGNGGQRFEAVVVAFFTLSFAAAGVDFDVRDPIAAADGGVPSLFEAALADNVALVKSELALVELIVFGDLLF